MIVLGVIPARLQSSRLPRKVLREIAGRPMLCHVYERARKAGVLSDVIVATDADEVVAACRGFGIPAVLTSGHVARLVEPFLARPETEVSTLCIVATAEEIASPSVNKVVFGPGGRALYFSKFGIPFDRDGRGVIRYKHVGLYAYRKAALDRFHALPPSILEQSEGLEQLRFLEHGVSITVMETNEPTIGVDTEEDLKAVEAYLAGRRV